MKPLAIVLNVLLLGVVGLIIAEEGIPQGEGLVYITVFIVSPLISIWTLLRSESESWIGLFFKRKALEEKSKIAKLSGGE